eukprot:TRINITY_DN27342_c0_g1_i1.p2 TRINITY_DN27342_c0_g1~~TRINITY_DN27342_c0_g1_i1.p2  ORF type:complete len:446 (+),score=104.91 TRINITY_DN27342_c0_g1_i1:75-1412(+)
MLRAACCLAALVIAVGGVEEGPLRLGDDVPPARYAVGNTEVFARNSRSGQVVVVFVNHEMWRQRLVQNLHCSWRRIGFQGYVFVAVDDAAHRSLVALEPDRVHYHAPWWVGVGGHLLRATNVKTEDYVGFIHRRTRFVEALLLSTELTVVVCDVDTVWTRDFLIDGTIPFAEPAAERCDGFVVNSAHRGGGGPAAVEPLGGFIVARNNHRIHMWYRVWTALEHCLQSKEQPAMHAALHVLQARFARQFHLPRDLVARNLTADGELVLCVLHDAYFPTGFHLDGTYFTDDYSGGAAIALAHASISNKSAKEEWFAGKGLWLVDGRGECLASPANPERFNTTRHAVTDPQKLRSGLRRAHIGHHTDLSQRAGSEMNCTAMALAALPAYRVQVEAGLGVLRHSFVLSISPQVSTPWHAIAFMMAAVGLALLRRMGFVAVPSVRKTRTR